LILHNKQKVGAPSREISFITCTFLSLSLSTPRKFLTKRKIIQVESVCNESTSTTMPGDIS